RELLEARFAREKKVELPSDQRYARVER
ncbi:MAG: hypothetical protein ACI8X5_002208, partial [Planctomycetota bacterium]